MIASDASPLICLAKVGKLYLLREIFERVLIEEEVKRETIDKGYLYSYIKKSQNFTRLSKRLGLSENNVANNALKLC